MTDWKRVLDVAVAGPLLVVTAPIQGAVAVAVVARLGRPVLFRQRRPGRDGVPFTIFKFRTMLPVDAATGRVDDAARMTRLGRFLRATSLDELPTLVNVLRGDMSLVGPRPLLMAYLPRYSATQARRHEVRPGLTGLAQVGGRNALSWADKFALDLRYVDHWSMALDGKILATTMWKELSRQGIGHEDHPTAPRFEGNRADR